MPKTFLGGIHPSGNKSFTSGLEIEVMPPTDFVYVSLMQHSGKPAKPAVKVGDEVVTGGMIGEADGKGSCNIFSPCCGTVTAIEQRVVANGSAMHIVIKNNGKSLTAHLPPLQNPTKEQIIQRVADCGVAGMGGAGFPTAAKLSPGCKIDKLIINGAECEPYITCDYRIMKEYTQKFVSGAIFMQTALGASEIIIGVENNKADAIEILKQYISDNSLNNITVTSLKVKYPQGSDRQLIYSLTGKKIGKGTRSSNHGIVVANVHTALSVYMAVAQGIQSYSRVVTVTGGAISNPKNLWVLTGTRFKEVIDFCGGFKKDNPPVKIISGGPMMGSCIYTTDIAVTKTTSCILLMDKSQSPDIWSSSCINCGKCGTVCPMGLMPMNIDRYALAGRYGDAKKWGAEHCIECGSCSYICPAKRQLVQSVVLAKSKLRGSK